MHIYFKIIADEISQLHTHTHTLKNNNSQALIYDLLLLILTVLSLLIHTVPNCNKNKT